MNFIPGMIPFYDNTKDYETNYTEGPFGLLSEHSRELSQNFSSQSFLGFRVDIPFGIPAGPLLNSRYVKAAWNWGFSIATYKTVRGNTYPCHPYPNVIKVNASTVDVHPGDTVEGTRDVKSSIDVEHDGITNSFGVPSRPPEIWQSDVRDCLKSVTEGNVLILSFMGTKQEGMDLDTYISDFAKTCTLAEETGAPILEVNFSCPNVGKEGLICNDVATSRSILESLKAVKGNTPLLVKIGYFAPEQQEILEQLLTSIYDNAEGVVGINTIQAKVVDSEGQQELPGNPVRLHSGICGAAIRWAGLEMAERIMMIKKKRGWKDFAVVGVGGITKPEDFFRYMKIGVDAAQSATGAMWKPDLALEIRKQFRI